VDNNQILSKARKFFENSEIGSRGVNELEFLLNNIPKQHFIEVDFSLARGLNYYTGLIVEVKMDHTTNINLKIGSIGGGGRYDDLTGLFGVPNIPGVGISFGVDRIYDVMEELNLFPANVHVGTQVLFFNLGEKESRRSFEIMQQLRQKGVRSELYHETAKFDKQFKYAEKKNIPHIIIIGEKEMAENTCNIKTLASGQQQTIAQQELINYSF
ncbi:MAG: His/Gly/Thr/Pro-type tRNA ligase C-terminal domain-containing protein, partial [Bacteroidota bacterium]